jgi:pimeloyl-ACP methyl ester carboxylesterase
VLPLDQGKREKAVDRLKVHLTENAAVVLFGGSHVTRVLSVLTRLDVQSGCRAAALTECWDTSIAQRGSVMPYAQRDGLRLYYEREGSGEPELLFVHGWCCDHTFFGPQFSYFKSSYTTTTLDLRGCGRSDCPDEGYELPSLADDLAWFCAEVGISRPVVIGHSLGAMIAIEVAARYPSLVQAVVVDDPGPINPLPETARIYEGFAAELDGPDGEAVRRAWVEAGAGPTADAELRHLIVETMCAVPLRVATAMIRGVTVWNGIAALALCEMPLLVLGSATGGSNDPARLRPLKPDFYFGVTVGAGHFHQLEVPEQVTSMIERFLEVAITEPRIYRRRL